MKPYELLNAPKDEFALNAYVKYYQNGKYESIHDIEGEDKANFMRFVDANYKALNPKIVSEFNKNEKAVSSIIDSIKNSVNSGKYNDEIQQNLDKLYEFLKS